MARLPESMLTPAIKAVLKERPDVELVVYITLAHALEEEKWERMRMGVDVHPERMKVIRAEASHPDFGYLNLHTEIERIDGAFHFKPIVRSMPIVEGRSDVVLSDLWPKGKLNS